jgi:hypothetical protein
MQPDISRLISKVHDAAVALDAWPEALKSLTDVIGVAGAAYIVQNKIAGRVEFVCFSGLSAALESKYIEHYAARDPYSPLLSARWRKLSDCIPDPLLRRSEWYNDFVLACGVRDIVGSRLIDTESHSVIVGIHQQIGRTFPEQTASVLKLVGRALRVATRRHTAHLSLKERALDGNTAKSQADGSRYFFHIRNGIEFPDETGSIFFSPNEAIQHALLVASELPTMRVGRGSQFE